MIFKKKKKKKLEKLKLIEKKIRKLQTTLERSLNLIILNTVFHQLNIALKIKFKVVTNQY